MKVYRFKRLGEQNTLGDVWITVEEPGKAPRTLKHRVRHSPTGMNWGYSGSGPADCARSLAWDVLGREPSPREYQSVKVALVAPMPVSGGAISESQVRNVLDFAAARLAEDESHELGGEG